MVKQRIIEEASELFGHSGVKGITMDDIARHLGISKRTIYENFKDKEDLLNACIDALHEETCRNRDRIFREADNVADAILAILEKSAGQAEQQRFNMVKDIMKYYPQVYREHLSNFINDDCRNMEQMIQRGINEGIFRDDLNPVIVANHICLQNENIPFNTKYIKYMERFSLSEIFENVAITFLRGICTAKGIEIIDKYKKK